MLRHPQWWLGGPRRHEEYVWVLTIAGVLRLLVPDPRDARA